MNSDVAETLRPPAPWYRVGAVWLILILLGSTVVGSISLLVTSITLPSDRLVLPNEKPFSSKVPPIHPAPATAPRD
ncbi:MAG: hypothetical protein ABI650_01150 [Dokdonella sp.]